MNTISSTTFSVGVGIVVVGSRIVVAITATRIVVGRLTSDSTTTLTTSSFVEGVTYESY